MRKELLGVVGVDSGHLAITDPMYINNLWLQAGDEPPKIYFWGEAAKRVAACLKDMGIDVVKGVAAYEAVPRCIDDTVRLIENFAGNDNIDIRVVYDTPVDKFFDVADNNKQGGQVHYPLGHPGLGVIFQSGLGDGVYEVWAYYDDIEGWGERIVKVEVILIPEQDS